MGDHLDEMIALSKTLPKTIEASELSLVKKELWLRGLWLEEVHPGLMRVLQEPVHVGTECYAVDQYMKGWNESTWCKWSARHDDEDEESP